MKLITLTLLLTLCQFAFGHDGGHGPSIKDTSLYGGKITAVIDEKELPLGPKAKLIYKGELVRDKKSGEVKLYIYDQKMKPLDLSKFGKKVKAELIYFKGKKEMTKNFPLKLDKSSKQFFLGKIPKKKRVPYNIDVRVKMGKKKLFAAFDGLD